MTKISRQEIEQLGRISCLDIHEDEVDALMGHIEQVLTYAQRVTEIVADAPAPMGNVNIVREDISIKTDTESILAQAPVREGDYFVVPRILEGGQ
jgi:aspartyl/glutamyl-tRNA(Asn/Gln) amidotransferase C subunit